MGLIVPVVLLGLLASLSPSTIVVFILLLATTKARVNAAAFLIGWSISLAFVFFASYALGGAHVLRTQDGRTGVEILELLLGVGLVAFAVHQWRRRDRTPSSEGVPSSLTERVRRLNPWGAAMLGVIKQPWALTAAAALVVVQHHTAFLIAVIAFVIFTVVSTATVGLIYLYYARQPGEAQVHLENLRARVVQAGPMVLVVVSLLVGVVLVVDGVTGLTHT